MRVTVLAFFAVAWIGCKQGPSIDQGPSIVGTWKVVGATITLSRTFDKSGHYTMRYGDGPDAMKADGTYTFDGNVLKIHILSTRNMLNLPPGTETAETVTWKDKNHVLLEIGSGAPGAILSRMPS